MYSCGQYGFRRRKQSAAVSDPHAPPLHCLCPFPSALSNTPRPSDGNSNPACHRPRPRPLASVMTDALIGPISVMDASRPSPPAPFRYQAVFQETVATTPFENPFTPRRVVLFSPESALLLAAYPRRALALSPRENTPAQSLTPSPAVRTFC